MSGFDDLVLHWGGQDYAIPPQRQMEIICRVETALIDGKDRQAYQVLMQASGPPMAMVARVYADALAYAGAKVQPIEVFRALTASVSSGGELYSNVISDLLRILGLLSGDEQDAGEKKAKATASKKASRAAG